MEHNEFIIFGFHNCYQLQKGLEYVIEIQHNTMKKMQNGYHCLLCDAQIKCKNQDSGNPIEVMKAHLKGSKHKLKYLVSCKSIFVLPWCGILLLWGTDA